MFWGHRANKCIFFICKILSWQLRWVGYSDNKLLSGTCSKTSYCQQILQLQQIKKIKFMPDNKITRYYYNCDYSIKISTNFFHSLNSLLSIDHSIVTALTIYLQTHKFFAHGSMNRLSSLEDGSYVEALAKRLN